MLRSGNRRGPGGPTRVTARSSPRNLPYTAPVRILIVEDDPKLRSFLRQGLEEQSYECVEAASVEQAQAALQEAFDLVLLDVMLPDGEGWQVLKGLREHDRSTAVIFLTARSLVDERVQGLEMGADDYVIKPFEFRELLARIHVVMRRRNESAVVQWGALRVDALSRQVHHDSRAVDLSPKEFALLHYLVVAGERVVPREELLRKVWMLDFDPGTNVVEVGVARLRRKIDHSGPERIETVTGEGYRMAPALGDPE